MNKANHAAQQQETPFGAFKKAVARFIGVKRLQHGVDFAEDDSIRDVFVGKRQYNMGDLWREPLDANSDAEEIPSGVSIEREQ
ncbi:hypothetical protein [Hyphococcus luteus]|uniref:Uncharacterized protein n=1 Tax=Hyphococcus luteus TaxID=2058213 RepID=A0A2S7K3X9_9PROT|nr:hypothetical protein [Marinicaulis flavus]PQA87148.1 hypothetical protein CW354_14000 [Marinicaulis flavus]